DADLRLKNEQFLKFEERLNKFMVSVKSRLKSVKVDSVAAEKSEACKSEIDKLLKRTNDEHDFLLKKLQDKYMSSRYYELIPLNRTMRAMDEKALEWDEIFTDFERNFFPSEKDIRRLATLQLKRLFLDRTETAGLATSIEEGNEEVSREAEGAVTNNEPATSTSSGTPMACEKTDDMLTSVVKENHSTDVKFSEGVESHEKVPEEGISARAAEPVEVQPSVPVAAPLQAIDREDVRHLDLAVSSNFSEITMSNEQAILSPNSQARSPIATRNAKALSDSVAPDPAPLNPTITQRIEQMRSEAAAGAVYDGTQESKIPRPTPSGTSHPPPLYRAQSQPANLPRRDTNYSSDSSVHIDPVPSVAFLSTNQRQSESQKPNFSDSAKSVEKRMSERLGLGGFRPGKTPSSLIPRSIPSKKIDSKVSTLAKHFEQLSREFEKERLRERRQRAATSRQARANPLASSQPVVEVYHDAHEAVQEREPLEETLEDKPPARSGPNETIFEEDNITDDTAPTTTPHSPIESRHGQDTTAETTDIEE
ncbi:Mitochondrial distribution and morphology protein 12, partial [Cryomyces antarcticus]